MTIHTKGSEKNFRKTFAAAADRSTDHCMTCGDHINEATCRAAFPRENDLTGKGGGRKRHCGHSIKKWVHHWLEDELIEKLLEWQTHVQRIVETNTCDNSHGFNIVKA